MGSAIVRLIAVHGIDAPESVYQYVKSMKEGMGARYDSFFIRGKTPYHIELKSKTSNRVQNPYRTGAAKPSGLRFSPHTKNIGVEAKLTFS